MKPTAWLLPFLPIGAIACATAASGQRDALEAAKIEWLRRGAPSLDSCTPQLRALSSYAFEASCGATVTYVRCTYGSSETCCETMPERDAVETVHLVTYHDTAASRVCE